MARLEELIESIQDAQLRGQVTDEVKALKARTRFGLVFERHIPETAGLAINGGLRVGDQVVLRRKLEAASYRVSSINGSSATIADVAGQTTAILIRELLVIRRFGDPIYPTLTSLGSIERSKGRPYHTVIDGENYHALQLLLHTSQGQVDCIYIDPPYNTGAKDWKYSNRYVDANDSWRHSKWLSMMERRLRLAKLLLKPDGVLIVMIDEHEVHHLGLLLEQLFPEYLRYMITIVISARGNFKRNFSRVEEHAMFCCPDSETDVISGAPVDYLPESGELGSDPYSDDDDPASETSATEPLLPIGEALTRDVEYRHARRRGPESRRADRPSMFYPVYIDENARKVVRVGAPIPLGQAPSLERVDGLRPIWPIDTKDNECRWRIGADEMSRRILAGRVVLGAYNAKRDSWTINLVVPRVRQKNIKTVWRNTLHDAGTYGSSLLNSFVGRERLFDFPKSLYAVRDTLATVVRHRPDALILDFFAGSGTTLHATCLLNAEDGGRRRCILVTNNEVDERRAAALNKQGHYPGDPDYEAEGIFNLVTRPRCSSAVTGLLPDGRRVEGTYDSGAPYSAGFDENVEFFRLEYLDPDEVELGHALDALQPLMWLRAGARGARPKRLHVKEGFFVVKDSGYAVLLEESALPNLIAALNEANGVRHVYLRTDSEDAYAEMCQLLNRRITTERLYSDYLDEFRRGIRASS